MNRRSQISEREREILVLASEGQTDKVIAQILGLSIRTVGTYWERMKRKTGGASRGEMIMNVLGTELELAAAEARRAMHARNVLLENAEHYAVFGIDLEGKLMEWNVGVLRVLGYEQSEFDGRDFSVVFTPEDVKNGEPATELEGARAKGRFIERRYHLRRDGSRVWIDGTLVAIRDDKGSLLSFAKIMRDDSERKALEQEVKRLMRTESQLPLP